MQRAQAKEPRNEIYFVIQLLYTYIDAPLFSYHHHKDKAMSLLRFIDNFHDNTRSINIEDIRSEIGKMKNNPTINKSGTFCSLCNFILSGELKQALPAVKIETIANSNHYAVSKLCNYAKIGFFEWRHHRNKAQRLADLIDDPQNKNVETILNHSTIDDKTNTVGAFAQTVREIRFNQLS
jgi:hypothetical protein